MDAIVAGKVEKVEGSLVFKTIENYDINTSFLVKQLTKKDFEENYVKIVVKQNQTNILSLNSLFITDTEKSGTKIINLDNNKWCAFYRTSTNDYRLFVKTPNSNYSISEALTSVEIGTLE